MKTNRSILLLAGLVGGLLLSCAKQDESPSDGQAIRLSASIDGPETRVDDGPVVTGNYNLTYYSTPDTRSVCMASFSNSKGYPLVTNDAGIYNFLKWSDVKLVASRNYYLFTLDNLNNNSDIGVIPLDESYRAAPLNNVPDLDIVWGNRTVISGTEKNGVAFTLSHRMSKLSLEISVNSHGIVLDGKRVKITLSGIIDQPATFNRSSGAVGVGGTAPGEVVLYDDILIQADNKYTLPSAWIFPPQTFKEDNWPKMRIEFDNMTYEGTLNRFMIREDGDSETPVSMTGFDAGRHLTLRASLSQTVEDVELIFMPVWIKKWEEIDNIGITAKQRGVYTESDYRQLVEAYNLNPKYDKALEKYGTFNATTNRWNFILYRNIGNAGDAATMPKFKDADFDIQFNGYKVFGFSSKDDLIEANFPGGGSQTGQGDTGQ